MPNLSTAARGTAARAARAALALALAAAAACGDAPRDGADTDGASAPPTPPAPPVTTPATGTPPGAPTTVRPTVVRSYPHDTEAYTQGLLMLDGRLYEGTGQWGKSSIREVDLATGAVKRKRDLAAEYFGEGIAALGGLLYQLTWKEGKAFVYDLATFAPRDTFTYQGEGWGLTTDGESLVMSDGTARIRFLDPKTFAVRRTIDVREGTSPVSQLNELEWVEGEIFANVWQSAQIVRIDPKTGAVTGWLELGELVATTPRTGTDPVLNGIAYDAQTKKLYVTGKQWARLYEIALPNP